MSVGAYQPFDTLVDILYRRAQQHPEALAYRFLPTGELAEPAVTRSYGELAERARAIGARLQAEARPGDRVLLLYPPGLDYLEGFFGCLSAGVVPVPAYPPDLSRIERSMPRLSAILSDCQCQLVLTTRALHAVAESLFPLSPQLAALRWLATDDLPAVAAGDWRAPAIRADDLAFLQYTSGSTGDPKGVMLTHRNLLANLRLMQEVVQLGAELNMVLWLPPYHDMGLIGGLLQTLYTGGRCTFFSPLDFLARPVRWLRAISHYRANISPAPNFAFELCARKVREADKVGLDLRSWIIAPNGAEPIRAETLERFQDAFQSCGFVPQAHAPGYGLAEATLVVSAAMRGSGMRATVFDEAALSRGRAEVAPVGRRLVSCGAVRGGQRVLIVDPQTRSALGEDAVGEIWIQGDCVATGYWDKPAVNAEIFGARLADSGEGPWLRSGDLGFLHAGELYIAGRRKDLLILRGRNHYPQDLEVTAERAQAGIRPGCVAAFAIERAGEESLGLAAELDGRARPAVDAVVAALCEAMAAAHDVAVAAIWLVAPGGLPKTSSGKLQRYACRELAESGALDVLHHWERPRLPPAAAQDDEPAEGGGRTGDGAPSGPPVPRPASPVLREPAAAAAAADPDEAELRQLLIDWLVRELKVPPATLSASAQFGQLGVDSVAAVSLLNALEQRLGRKLSTSLIWNHPTVGELARYLAASAGAEPSALQLDVQPVAPRAEYPLSFTEEYLLTLIEHQPRQEAYNLFVPLRIVGPLDAAALEAAWGALIQRQDNLRTAFLRRDGTPVRRVLDAVPFHLEQEDLSALPADSRDAAVLRACAALRHVHFDLARPPLLSVRLIRLAAEESLVLISISHLVSDAWGLGVMRRELEALYQAALGGEARPLPALTLRAADFAVATEAAFRELRARGRAAFPPYPAEDFRFPYDYPLPPSPSIEGRFRIFPIDEAMTARLESAGQAHGFSPAMACLVAFQSALHRLTRREQVMFAVVQGNRRVQAMRDVVAHVVYSEMFCGDVRGAPPYLSLLDQARRFTLEERIPQQIRTLLAAPPAMRILFNFQNFAAADRGAPSRFTLARELNVFPYLFDSYDLLLQIFPMGTSLFCNAVYRSEVIRAETIESIIKLFGQALTELATDPRSRFAL